ncbi:ABC transporter ATP-binding protein [Halorarum halophilum]|uniref:ABC-type D-xylose/L-arabinose transporter n=1 Tax=Halorarum halophilum TaxID=2743090 RepID=A0A7D5K1U0_9EURY|nr:ABC transporter ATP-binding protein [Halobaculum halophilum]QLG28221.1 ABC transporter ATP-binding protein [Halobaculum halophilum]
MSDTAGPKADERTTQRTDRDVSVELRDVTKTFTEEDGSTVVAVEDLDLTIYDGEFVVIVGPSGCGKTTTLRMIAGLEEPTGGDIVIEGRDVKGLDPRERDIAMVFQNYALYPHKTVHDNIAFPLQIRKYPDEEVEQRVQEVAESLDIPGLLDRRPSDLSGGQQQRVALGRAIVRDPAVFLFDEPLSNLDAKLRIEMRTELNKLHDRVGKTSVYVTHDQVEAMTLSDRVVVLDDGQLQQFAPPQELYNAPANKFVAGFIGEPPMNFFTARVEERGGEWWVVSDAFDLRLPDEHDAKLREWTGDLGNAEFGVRPEHLFDVAVQGDPGEGATFDVLVKVIEPMGPHMDVTVAPVDRPDDEDAEFTARVSNESDVSIGGRVTLGVELDKAHLFDGRTGENVLR